MNNDERSYIMKKQYNSLHTDNIIHQIISVYFTLLLIFSLGDRFFFTKTIWDNVITRSLKFISIQCSFQDVILIIGIPIFLYMIIKIRKTLLRMDTVVLLIYILILIGTAVFDNQIDTIHNLAMTFVTVEPLLFCYYVCRFYDKKGLEKLLKTSLGISSCFWSIGCYISIYQYFINYSGSYHFGNVPATNHQGVYEGRL